MGQLAKLILLDEDRPRTTNTMLCQLVNLMPPALKEVAATSPSLWESIIMFTLRLYVHMRGNISIINPGEGFGVFSDASYMESRFSGEVLVTLIILMSLLVLVTVLGNTLVIVAFVVDKRLRSQSNFFLLNLALCDFVIGAICIPIYIPYILTGKWLFGRGLCKFWLVSDYVMGTCSTFNIVLISYDRFLSVTQAVAYRMQQGMTSKAIAKMIAVWTFAFLLYGPAIVVWEYVVGGSVVVNGQCYAEFNSNWYFLLCASVFEFFTPIISVSYFNLCIYWNLQKRKQQRLSTLTIRSMALPSGKDDGDVKSEPSRSCSVMFQDKHSVPQKTKPMSKLLRDKQIAKSLAIIVGIFGICWAPYTLLMIVRAACKGTCVYDYWYETTFWLLWLNSSINPFLYPLCHASFRNAFKKMLCPNPFVAHTQGRPPFSISAP
ncbi:histamine H3 receptor-like [Rhinatrema bivittatum]|uniref:histamine H3 receptor-like n=1 Tax=Rhinatrema bivittatum TaxID=194408 RepID=UPI00112B9C01|nr:histamine H3 receptor-like [Rhinatrema bivittatum]